MADAATQQHSAFMARLAVALPGTLACVEAWQKPGAPEDRILAGLQDGTLLMLAPGSGKQSGGEAEAGSDKPTGASWRVVQIFKAFGSNRSLRQLQASAGRGILLSLGDQGVSVHRLPAFALTCQATRTRGGKCFAWDDGRAMLAVAVKRRVQLLHYDGLDFVELKELALPHSPHRMQWLGNSLCLAFKAQYVMLDVETGEQTPLPGFGKDTTPAMAALPDAEALLAMDGHSQVFGRDGKAMKRVLQWSAAPAALLFSQPHVLALLPSAIEVRSLRAAFDFKLLQSVVAPALTSAGASPGRDGSLFAVAPTGEVWQIAPVPLLQQAQELADQGRYEEAQDICSLCPPDETGERKALEDALHMRHGHQLFAGGEYGRAMALFGSASAANPVFLLRLFPSLAPEPLLAPVAGLFPDYSLAETKEPEGEQYTRALNMLLPYLLSWRTRLAAADDAGPASPARGASPAAGRSTGKGSPGKGSPARREATGAGSPEGRDGGAAAGSGSPGLPDRSSGGSDRPAKHGASAPASPPKHPELQQLSREQRRDLSILLDTALLKAMLALSDTGHLLRFVQRDNFVDLQAGRAALAAAGRYSELVALLQARGRHDAALELIRGLSQAPASLPVPPAGAAKDLAGLPGVWAAIKYIGAMGPTEVDLIREHARWILQQDAEAGIDMFAQMRPAMSPDLVLPIIQAEVPLLVVPYLESALSAGSASHDPYDGELAARYLELALQPPLAAGGESTPAPLQTSQPEALERLKALVATSPHIDADALLRRVPAGRLLEVRALLLERFGRHQEILRIYIDELQKPALAEAYCDRVYTKAVAAQRQAQGQEKQQGSGSSSVRGNGSSSGGSSSTGGGHAREGLAPSGEADDEQPGGIYLQLIRVFLSTGGGTVAAEPGAAAERHAELARILSRKHGRLDAVRALCLIPDELRLGAMLPFLEGALQGLGERQRSSAIVRSLRRAGHLQTRAELVVLRQRSVVVTEERACSICFKRIGTSACVTSGSGALQHFSCHKRAASSSGPAAPGAASASGPLPQLLQPAALAGAMSQERAVLRTL